jgi:hypothetical protein
MKLLSPGFLTVFLSKIFKKKDFFWGRGGGKKTRESILKEKKR